MPFPATRHRFRGVGNPFDADPILVEVVRNGYVESVHRGRVAVADPDGRLVGSIGAEFAPTYPRSASKPLQAVGMLRAGLDLAGPHLALVCSSHSGEPIHVDGVRALLARGGLDESVLQTPPDWPLDEAAREAWIRNGQAKAPIAMNCSGKHAGMIRTAQLRGDELATYRDPDHPVQLAIVTATDDLAHEQAQNLVVDGCGAPAYALSVYGLARAYARLASATEGPEATVAAAIREHPELVSGTTRDEAALIRAVPGLIAKAGAEATYAVGLPDGRGVAIKISDGSPRARAVAMAGVLQRLGIDNETLTEQVSAPVLGHGERVGEIRPYAETLRQLG
jgi:L-asparaginase II